MSIIKSAYSKKSKVTLTCGPGLTKQSHNPECDINQIMAKFLKTGLIEHRNTHAENYGFATSDDYHKSLNILHLANQMFDDLPSKARTKFKNDPAEFLDYVQNPDNEDSLYDLGLTSYPPAPPDPPEPAPAAPAPAQNRRSGDLLQ